MFYGDTPTIDNEPVLPSKPCEQNMFPLPKELESEDYSKLDNMSQDSENEYVPIQDYWGKQSEDDEEKVYSQEKEMKMLAVMKMQVMIRTVRKMKVMVRTLISTNLMNSYTGCIGDSAIIV
eukprot:8220948-Ditylum_brightwellii.AAC.1